LKEQVAAGSRLSVSVLFTADAGAFDRGYERARRLHADVHWHRQEARSIKAQLDELVRAERREFFTFFVDDDVVVRPFGTSDPPFRLLRERRQVAAVALRLHPGVRYCQPLNLRTPPPRLDANLTYRWKPSTSRVVRLLRTLIGHPSPRGDWAGSMFVDGNVFRHGEFVDYFASLPEITHVPHIEPVMLRRPLRGNRVAIYPQARVFNLVMNRVDVSSRYPHAGGSPEDFNARFLNGERLAYDQLKQMRNESAHVVVHPRWEPLPEAEASSV
jgi:hypothetical protein